MHHYCEREKIQRDLDVSAEDPDPGSSGFMSPPPPASAPLLEEPAPFPDS